MTNGYASVFWTHITHPFFSPEQRLSAGAFEDPLAFFRVKRPFGLFHPSIRILSQDLPPFLLAVGKEPVDGTSSLSLSSSHLFFHCSVHSLTFPTGAVLCTLIPSF